MTDHRTEKERTLPDHLGGHFGNSHVDAAVLDYLIARYQIRSMLDIGCGPGAMVDLARERGLYAWGIDGDYTIEHDYIIVNDFTQRSLPVKNFDLIWCFEFAEHLDAAYQDHWLETANGGKVLFLSTPAPGFGGWHHVNEQPEDYWITLLAAHDWTVDAEATQWVRLHGDHHFSRKQGLVFVKIAPSS